MGREESQPTLASDILTGMPGSLERCAPHALHFDPTVATGCVLCRKERPASRWRGFERWIVRIGVVAMVLCAGLALAKAWSGLVMSRRAAPREVLADAGDVTTIARTAPPAAARVAAGAARRRDRRLLVDERRGVAPRIASSQSEVGRGTGESVADAARHACRVGAGADCARVAREAERSSSPDLTLIAELRRAGCDKGDVESCDAMERIYAKGRGVRKDERRALAMHDDAVAHARAAVEACDGGPECDLLKIIVMKDLGGTLESRRVDLAPDLLAQECTAGRQASCLALQHYYSDSAHPDPTKAAEFSRQTAQLMNRSCESGNTEACLEFGMHETSPSGADASRGRAVLDDRCKAQDYRACWALGGSYGPRSSWPRPAAAADAYRRAVALADSACTAGDVAACALVASAYASGKGVAPDSQQAERYRWRAAELMTRTPVPAVSR